MVRCIIQSQQDLFVLAIITLVMVTCPWAKVLAGTEFPAASPRPVSSKEMPFKQIGQVQAVPLSLVWLQGTFFANRNIFVTESSLEHVRLWDARSAEPVSNSLEQPKLNDFCLSAQGKRLFTSGGGEVQVWDVNTSKVRAAVKAAKDQVVFLDASSDGTRFLTIPSEDTSTLTVWSASVDKLREIYRRRYAHELRSAQFDPTATYIVDEEFSGSFHLLVAKTGREVCAPIDTNDDTLSSTPYDAKFDATGRLLGVPLKHRFKIVGSGTGKILAEGHLEGSLETRQLALADDGSLLAIATWDSEHLESGPVLLFEAATGKLLREFGSRVSTCQLDPRGRWALCNHAKMAPELWDLRAGVLVETFSSQGAKVGDALMSPDGETILVGTGGSTISIWRLLDSAAATRP